ncbi:chromosome partitioning protein [Variovorax sp. HW608]|uniref:AAA family ATPase n=1 Tax=Variovorax sp. HW608 TaxID=1034889 RepID=UPI00081FD6AE|nr:AAA family ATPase [Variovorax sp. HW608]SCK20885.1 chromosome partitioning protein [Variovorax sp. HW608]
MNELTQTSPTEIFLKTSTMADIKLQAQRASEMVGAVRAKMLAPSAVKTSPVFIQKEVAERCGLEPGQFSYRMKNADLPPLPQGNFDPKSRRREFSLAETRTWVKEFRRNRLRPPGAEAVVISIANFKGGVGKSTTAMTLAQGLTLLGHRVLLIDADPQGSLSTLTGLVPDLDVQEEDTFMLLALGEEDSIRYAIRPTYWDGLDIVAAAPLLFGIEFNLPARQVKEMANGFEFWNVLNLGIDDVREDYDVIIIDTAPALSYGTVNALMASNGIIMPLPPNALDFASGAQFWTLFTDLTENLIGAGGSTKTFDFINVLLSRVDSDDASTMVRKWIIQTYGDKVLPAEIPRTVVTSAASAEFNTVYDISRYDWNARTYKRAREAYDNLVAYMEGVVRAVWLKNQSHAAEPAVRPVIMEGV